MATGHKIVDPSGRSFVVTAENRDDIVERVNYMQGKWSDYCDRNWLNNSGEVFSPELKIKRFLDSLAYFLLLGSTEKIETLYRSVMHAKREIPASNCPSSIENLLYATGELSGDSVKEEYGWFSNMLEKLDDAAKIYEVKTVPRVKQQSKFGKKLKSGIHGGTWHRVDTDGRFQVGDEQYLIESNAAQYGSVQTEYGDYYAMDKILYSDGKFYDMNYDDITAYVMRVA